MAEFSGRWRSRIRRKAAAEGRVTEVLAMARYIRRASYGGRRGPRFSGGKLVIGVVIALVAFGSWYFSTQTNPITGKSERVALTTDQEIALGLQAAPEMAQQHGGLDRSEADQQVVDRVGRRLLSTEFGRKAEDVYDFEFHLLADAQTVNAFALPGGQIFVTRALYDRFETEAQLAGVLGHEIGHVIERHGAERLSEQQLTQGLVGAVAVGADSVEAGRMAAAIGSMVNMKYGREDELESDGYGVTLLAEAGYDPTVMIRVMEILRDAGGGGRQAEFFSTHPNPENRIQRIEERIRELFPNGVPEDFER